MKEKSNFWLLVASLLMIAVALARGLGGLLFLLRGNRIELDRPILASSGEIVLMGFGLLLISVLFLTSAIGVFRRNFFFWRLGIFTSFLFIIDGALNGTLLFGHPLETGTIMNIVAAILIIGALLLGKDSLAAGSQ